MIRREQDQISSPRFFVCTLSAVDQRQTFLFIHRFRFVLRHFNSDASRLPEWRIQFNLPWNDL
jgi:hypothetical protein